MFFRPDLVTLWSKNRSRTNKFFMRKCKCCYSYYAIEVMLGVRLSIFDILSHINPQWAKIRTKVQFNMFSLQQTPIFNNDIFPNRKQKRCVLGKKKKKSAIWASRTVCLKGFFELFFWMQLRQKNVDFSPCTHTHYVIIISNLLYSLTMEQFSKHPFSMGASHFAQYLYQKLLCS